MFRAEFAAVCDACGTTTEWVKANRMAEVDGQPAAVKGFRCADCDTFERKVVDAEGEIRKRDG